MSGVHADKSQSLSDALKVGTWLGCLWLLCSLVMLLPRACMQERQFRFKDIVSLETGAVVHSLEHEVRRVSA